MLIPLHQGRQVCNIDDIVCHDPFHAHEYTRSKRDIAAPAAFKEQTALPQFILSVDCSRCDDGAERQTARAHKPPLSPEKYGFLIQHHAVRHITDKRRGGLVLIGSEVEMNV